MAFGIRTRAKPPPPVDCPKCGKRVWFWYKCYYEVSVFVNASGTKLDGIGDEHSCLTNHHHS